MIIMSILFAIFGVFAEYWWTQDWWKPQNITGTIIGLEDLLLGFSIGGISAVLYEELFKKRIYKYKSGNHNLGIASLMMLCFLSFLFIFYVLNLNSFIATTIIQIIIGIILVILRRDLMYDALLTGLSLCAVSIVVFILLEYLSPNFVENAWNWSYLTGTRFMAAPIEDLIFFFLSGFCIAPFYLFWRNEKLRKIPSR